MVLTHMLREVAPDMPVLFLDTFHHFAQTLDYRDEMAQQWGLNLITLRAKEPKPGCGSSRAPPRAASATRSSRCSRRSPITTPGSPGSAANSRRRARTCRRTSRSSCRAKTIRRVSPLAAWTARDMWQYAKDHSIKLMPLYDEGYTSIGCEPCTTPPLDPDNPRSGRWAGQKLECGIHIQAK